MYLLVSWLGFVAFAWDFVLQPACRRKSADNNMRTPSSCCLHDGVWSYPTIGSLSNLPRLQTPKLLHKYRSHHPQKRRYGHLAV